MNKYIDKASYTPLYLQLKDIIEEQIKLGKLEYGKIIPSERNLCKIYDVSQITVRQSLAILEQEEKLVRVPGKGTYVTEKPEKDARSSIGLITPDGMGSFDTPFILQVIAGIQKGLEGKRELILFSESESIKNNGIFSSSINGMIVTNPNLSDIRLRELKRKKIPVVVVGRPEIDGIHYVDNDNIDIGYQMTLHLLKKGCRKIGFIGYKKNYTFIVDRVIGYKKALREYGLRAHRKFLILSEEPENIGENEAKDLIKNGVDAIVCADDLIAVRASSCINSAGLASPHEIGIVCCNDSFAIRHTNPPITSMEIFPEELGFSASKALLKLIEGNHCEIKTIVPSELIVRNSSLKKRL